MKKYLAALALLCAVALLSANRSPAPAPKAAIETSLPKQTKEQPKTDAAPKTFVLELAIDPTVVSEMSEPRPVATKQSSQ
jgi:hypothetical protein